jgi:predicted N-acetyltransferase YhbS
MATARSVPKSFKRLGIASTLIDAAIEFARGRSVTGVLLLAAAALSSRVPGLGFAVSVLLRVYRRVR